MPAISRGLSQINATEAPSRRVCLGGRVFGNAAPGDNASALADRAMIAVKGAGCYSYINFSFLLLSRLLHGRYAAVPPGFCRHGSGVQRHCRPWAVRLRSVSPGQAKLGSAGKQPNKE